MRPKAIKALLVGGAFCAVALMIWPGCATPPLPSSRKPIASRKTTDFKFLKSGQASRSEIVSKLGEPDAYFADLRVGCYRINEVTKRKLWLCLFVIPINVETIPGALEVAFIEFDEQDRAHRFAIDTGFYGYPDRDQGLRNAAQKWVAIKAKEQRVH
jgi:hypothetical protein